MEIPKKTNARGVGFGLGRLGLPVLKKTHISILLTVTTVFLMACRQGGKDSQSLADKVYGFEWETGDALLDAVMWDEEDWISIKDPSIVQHEGKWHLFCTLRGKERSHAVVYSSFDDLGQMGKSKPLVMGHHDGYYCAPQVFYYTPQKKWYMVCQAKSNDWSPNYQAAYSTTTDITDPDSWSALQPMQIAKPKDDPYLDFWVICDEDKAYTFFTCDNGKMYRTETTFEAFPLGWSKPVLAFEGDIFEASHIYKLPEQDKYINLIEAQLPDDRRFFKAYLANSLDGEWLPAPSDSIGTYASAANVIQVNGAWTNSISHGELVRDGFDEKMEAHLDSPFVYQGVLHRNREGKQYGDIPWRLGLLKKKGTEKVGDENKELPLFTSAPFPVGTSIRQDMLRNDTVMDIAGYEFNSLTAGNAMKMHRVLGEGFTYNFGEADEYLAYAKAQGMRMFGHTLIWHTGTPDIVKQLKGDSMALHNFTKKYIDTLVSRYRGRIDAWDVVNEPVLDGSGELRENTWLATLGQDYVEEVFRMAHNADPTAKLFLNDYNIERDSAKLDGFLRLVERLKKKGTPIHGIGMQMHIRMDTPNEVIARNLKRCVDTGLLIHFSEVDIIFNKHDDTKGGGIQKYTSLTPEMMGQQAEKYKQIAQLYNAIVPNDQKYGITLWGFADRYTWIRYFFEIMDWPLIFDDNLVKKPAYYGLREGLLLGN